MVDLTALAAALADRYQLVQPLGEGGMATVHLAKDLRHDRMVALKVMHPELAAVVGAERFLAEIRTTANLQHPHILPLFDSGAVLGTVYYVMPFVEGETLRDRLRRETQLPVAEALAIARQVGDALHHAHQQGVIHRDIKPENILIRGADAFIADFGIALAAAQTAGRRMTETGMSVGTPAYMSPEQAMGERSITARSDVYSLGCVVYEMLTGGPPFGGPSAQAIIAKVLTEAPAPIRRQRERVPPEVEQAVLTALEKLPADRFATAAAFVQALGAPGSTTSGTTAAAPRAPGRWRPAAVAAAAATPALLLGLWVGAARESPPEPMRFSMRPGTLGGSFPAVVVGAPDGRSFFHCTAAGATTLRRWADAQPAPLQVATTGCAAAAFSPDGDWLAVVGIPTALHIVSVRGDAPTRTLPVEGMDDIAVYGGAIDWADDDALYLVSRLGVDRISPADGRRERLVESAGTRFYGFDALPGARRALVVLAAAAATEPAAGRIGVLDLGTLRVDTLMPGVAARATSGREAVVVRADGSMVLAGLDPGAARTAGTPRALPDSLGSIDAMGFRQPVIDVAADGTLLYWRAVVTGESRPVLVDHRGTEEALDPDWVGVHLIPRLSPRGDRLVAEMLGSARTELVIRNLRTGGTERPEMPGLLNGRPAWAPAGGGLTFISDRDGAPRAYRLDDDGSVRALAAAETRPVFHVELSPDGRWLLLRTDDQAPGRADIVAVRADGSDSTVRRIAADPTVAEYAPNVSPDGRWIAYVSNEGGRYDVRVARFPDSRERWTVSTDGGTEPRWSPDGRRLYFVSAGRTLVEATLALDEGFRVLSRRTLFPLEPYLLYGEWNRNYDLTPDGGKFLFLRRIESATTELVVVRDWLPTARATPVR